jgi:hypothetical protein
MPWTEKQNKLFRAAAHNHSIAQKQGIPQSTAAKLAHEGVKKDSAKDVALSIRRNIMLQN